MKTRKKKIMKVILLIMMMSLLLEIVVAYDIKNYGHSSEYFVKQQRSAIRSARGFRPNPLSTASGFGKRKDTFVSKIATEYDPSQPVTLVSALNPTKRTAAYWFMQHMRRYPDISRKFYKLELSNNKKNNRLLTDPLLKLTDFIVYF